MSLPYASNIKLTANLYSNYPFYELRVITSISLAPIISKKLSFILLNLTDNGIKFILIDVDLVRVD